MLSMLFLGFLIGMQHALEADHLAAVSSLAARESSVGRIVRHGADCVRFRPSSGNVPVSIAYCPIRQRDKLQNAGVGRL